MSPRGRGTLLAALTLATACTIAPATEGVETTPGLSTAPPPGYGTLRQEDVSLFLTSGDLQLMVTPLDESVTYVTAPDTQSRLASLVDAHAPRPGSDGDGLFLVSFYSEQPDVVFEPDYIEETL